MTRVPAESAPSGRDAPPSVWRIRNAALRPFAAQGAAATSLRDVAADAGVSLGAVQHHFATKSALIRAVDQDVLAVISSVMAEPIPEPSTDPVTELGRRVITLIAAHPDSRNYLGRAFIDGGSLRTRFSTHRPR